MEVDKTLPVAVIGMSGRFPGDAINPERLWKMCVEGTDAWTEFPSSKFNNEAFYHPDPSKNGAVCVQYNVKGGCCLSEDVSLFDAPFFGMTKTEAESLDPQQRLLLECCYETFENGSDTGVYIGSFCRDWDEMTVRDPDAMPMYQGTGSRSAMLANRLSYFFNLNGPSLSIDTACSSSLVALHLAVQALRTGDCFSAIVGGVNCILDPDVMITMSQMRFLSPDGRSYAYDHRANGYGRGEGVACVLLKPLHQALKDGDTIRAVIRNTGCNQDGKTPGITNPSLTAQSSLIQKVYHQAGLNPLGTTYVEAHGTGTLVGDQIEAASLYQNFGRGRTSGPIPVGSVKTNIGHLEGASGAAGLVKVVQMLEHRMIIGNANFEAPNERIPLEDWNLEIPTIPRPWIYHGGLRASINSFGYGGTNVHVILDNADDYLSSHNLSGHTRCLLAIGERMHKDIPQSLNGEVQAENASKNRADKRTNIHENAHCNGDAFYSNGTLYNGNIDTFPQPKQLDLPSWHQRLFVISAGDADSGKRQAQLLSEYLYEAKNKVDLDALVKTLSTHRSTLGSRASVVASSYLDLAQKLIDIKFTQSVNNTKVAFVFTGQGAQWHAMGRELIEVPEFQRSLNRSARYLEETLQAQWSVREELSRDVKSTRVNEPAISQPLCTILQIALVDLLQAWNIEPTAVVGHSSGEIAAAYAAGLISSNNAVAAAYYRGRLFESVDTASHPCSGSMAAVACSEKKLRNILSSLEAGTAWIACYNSDFSFTVTGETMSIEQLIEKCSLEGIWVRKLVVKVAYHSPRMEAVAETYRKNLEIAIAHDPIQRKACVMFSTVTGKRLEQGEVGPDYWVSNLINPVRFSDAVTSLYSATGKFRVSSRKSAIDMFVEVGPHAAMAGPVRQILQSDTRLASVQYVSVLKRGEDAVESSLRSAGYLFEHGVPVDLAVVNRIKQRDDLPILVDLPSYPWNHSTSYWAEPRESVRYRQRRWPRHDLLGAPVRFDNQLEPRWRNWIRISELPWLRDHRVQSLTVYPIAGYICMAIEAASQLAMDSSAEVEGYELREINLGQALVIPDSTNEVESMLSMRVFENSSKLSSNTWNEFLVSSATEDGTWMEHCRGLIRVKCRSAIDHVSGERLKVERIHNFVAERARVKSKCQRRVKVDEFYAKLASIGLDYGESFANLSEAFVGGNYAVGQVILPEISDKMPTAYHSPFVIHPSTLDTFIHSTLLVREELKAAIVPTSISRLSISTSVTQRPGDRLEVLCAIDRYGIRVDEASLKVIQGEETNIIPVIEMEGLKMVSLSGTMSNSINSALRKSYYKTQWCLDPAFISSEILRELCKHLQPTADEDMTLRLFDEMYFYMAEKVISLIPERASSQLSIKGGRLYQMLKQVRQSVLAEKLPYDVSPWKVKKKMEREETWEKVRQSGDEGNFFALVGDHLHEIILGDADALSITLQNDALGRYYAHNSRMARQYQQAAVYVDLLAMKNPHLRVLEIGAGTGGATIPILTTLGGKSGSSMGRFMSYTVTDISSGFLEKTQQKASSWGDLVNYQKLDIEQDPIDQGFDNQHYDLIVAANVLHATTNLSRTLRNVRKLLKPTGTLLLIELMRKDYDIAQIFGIFDGWWIAEEEHRQNSPLLTEALWDDALRSTGFSGLNATIWDTSDPVTHQCTMIISTAVESVLATVPETLVIVNEEENWEHLDQAFKASGLQFDTANFATANTHDKLCVIVDNAEFSDLNNLTPEEFEQLKGVLQHNKGLLWVTQGALNGSCQPDSNFVSGLMRTLRVELGGILVHLDLDSDTLFTSEKAAKVITQIFLQSFSGTNVEPEVEFSERGGSIQISRFVEDHSSSDIIASYMDTISPEPQPIQQVGRPLKLEIRQPGILDSIYWNDDPRTHGDLPPDYVEIEVKAAALNSRDAMMAMGQIEMQALGCECSGIITKVGTAVNRFKVGDHALAYSDGTFASLVRVSESRAGKIPIGINFEEATTLPVAFCTALHSIKLANLAKAETVLVHAATGGLGQALIMLCQHVGAEIFATVSTTEKKRFLMNTYALPEDHIFTSREDSFADGIRLATNGRGVDIIFNSLSEDLFRVTWECIASFGRFIELGKRNLVNNSRLEMARFAKNVTFAAVDLAVLFEERPRYSEQLLTELLSLLEQGIIKPPQAITTFGFAQIDTALGTLLTGRHLGKIVMVPQQDEIASVMPQQVALPSLQSNSTYLLVGGLGGIGRALAKRMVTLGARHIVFISRSGANTDAAKETIRYLEDHRVQTKVHKCDVAEAAQLEKIVEDVAVSFPPIKGVVHLGLVIKSALLKDMTHEIWQDSLRPKVQGTWNLHNLLPRDMDFFILLSSIVGVFGNASQTAYGAASTFQDAFASYRNRLGLPAVSIDLGMVVGIGYVAERDELARKMKTQGLDEITENETMAIIESAIVQSSKRPESGNLITGVGLGRHTGGNFTHTIYQGPQFSHMRRLARKVSGRTHQNESLSGQARDLLRQAASPAEVEEIIITALISRLSSLLMVPAEDINASKPMSDYGLDSLIAVEMRTWISSEFEATIPVLELLGSHEIIGISRTIARQSHLVNKAIFAIEITEAPEDRTL